MQGLAFVHRTQAHYEEAERLYTQALNIFRRAWGEQDLDTVSLMSMLAALYQDLCRYDEAESLQDKILATRRHVLGDEHPGTLGTKSDLGLLYVHQGRYEKAGLVLAETLKTARAAKHDEYLHTWMAMMRRRTTMCEANPVPLRRRWRVCVPCGVPASCCTSTSRPWNTISTRSSR